jgi:MSHA pilin protein MshD
MCTRRAANRASGGTPRSTGFTLIELIVFIVIVSVALVGVMTVLNVTSRSSADPMVKKQVLAAAEALLEEVQLQPFTFCDPSDRSAATATSAIFDPTAGIVTQCWDAVQGLGGGGAARIANTDNVGDYSGITLNPVTSIDGGRPLDGYAATITLTPESLGPAGPTEISSAACASATDCTALNVLRISVAVSGGGESVTLEGYRARHSPNMLP